MTEDTEGPDGLAEDVEESNVESPSDIEEIADVDAGRLSATDTVEARVEARLRLSEAQRAVQQSQQAVTAYYRDLAELDFVNEELEDETMTEIGAVLSRLTQAGLALEGHQ